MAAQHSIKKVPGVLADETGTDGQGLLPLSDYYNITQSTVKSYLTEIECLEAQADRLGWWLVAYELAILHAQTFAKTLRVDHG